MNRPRLSSACLIIFLCGLAASPLVNARTYQYDCYWQYDPVKQTDLNPLHFRFKIKDEAKEKSIHGETTILRYLRILTFEILATGELKITLSGAPGNALWDTYKLGETFEFTNDKDTVVTCLAITI